MNKKRAQINAPKANKTRARSGLHGLMHTVSVHGMAALDGRSKAMRSVSAWKESLLVDLGGAANVSTQKMVLVDLAARTKLFVDHVDSWLVQQESLVNKRKRSILPILRERMALADSLTRLMCQLGLERQARPVKPLHEFIRDMEREETQAQLPDGKDAA
jgi:hypothetical protein